MSPSPEMQPFEARRDACRLKIKVLLDALCDVASSHRLAHSLRHAFLEYDLLLRDAKHPPPKPSPPDEK
ncbi:MAG: hypothetical protein ACE5FN_00800 [Leptospirillia bacterium]